MLAKTDYRNTGREYDADVLLHPNAHVIMKTVKLADLQSPIIADNFVYVKDLREILTRDNKSWYNKAGNKILPYVYKTHVRFHFRIEDNECEYRDSDEQLEGVGVGGEVKILRSCNIIDLVSNDACSSMMLDFDVGTDYELEDLTSIEILSGESLTTLEGIIPRNNDWYGDLPVYINTKIKLGNYNYQHFFSPGNIKILGLANIDFSDITTAAGLFRNTIDGDFSNVNLTNKCVSFKGAFVRNKCEGTLDITGMDMSGSVDVSNMFNNIRATHIRGVIDTRTATSTRYMFSGADNLVSPNADEQNLLMLRVGARWTSEDGITDIGTRG